MTAIARNRNTLMLAVLASFPALFAVKNDEVINEGVMLALDATPEIVNAADAAGLKVIGRCPDEIDNSADGKMGNADLGCFKWENDASNPVVIGETVAYVKDNQTVCATGGSTYKVVAGLVIAVESDGVWVCQTLEGIKAAQALHDLGDASASAHIANTAAAAGACAGGSTPTATQVDTAIATAIAPLVTSINAVLAALEAQNVLKSS